jgi:hypothetical protein
LPPQATKIIYVISWVHLDNVDTSSREAVKAVYDAGRTRLAHLCDLLSSERVPSLPPGKISMALTQRPASPGRCVQGTHGWILQHAWSMQELQLRMAASRQERAPANKTCSHQGPFCSY